MFDTNDWKFHSNPNQALHTYYIENTNGVKLFISGNFHNDDDPEARKYGERLAGYLNEKSYLEHTQETIRMVLSMSIDSTALLAQLKLMRMGAIRDDQLTPTDRLIVVNQLDDEIHKMEKAWTNSNPKSNA